LHDDVVSTFAVYVDLIIFFEDDRHAFSSAVELDGVKDAIFDCLILFGAYAELVEFVGAEVLPSADFGHVDEGQFVGRGRVVLLVALLILFYDDVVAQCQADHHIIKLGVLLERLSANS
jgi:hypothetical protein